MNRIRLFAVMLCVSVTLTACGKKSSITESNVEINKEQYATFDNVIANNNSNTDDENIKPDNTYLSKNNEISSIADVSSNRITDSSKDNNGKKTSKATSKGNSEETVTSANNDENSENYESMPNSEMSSTMSTASEEFQNEDTDKPHNTETDSDIITSSNSNTDADIQTLIQSPTCYSAVLYCVDDDTTLYNDNGSGQTSPASLTKLLTAVTVLKYVNPDDIVTVGSEQYLVNAGSSLCYIGIGQRLTVYDLLTGMLMSSGNDAAYTAAVYTARAVYSQEELSDDAAVQRFCELMNDTAADLGMKNSHFTTPDGWDSYDQYTTAQDLALLARYALNIPEIGEIVGKYQKYVVFESGENITWTNSNLLLNPNSGYHRANAIGMKTGTTANAGCCLVAAFEINNKTYITVVTGCNTNDDRYSLTLKLVDEIH